MFLIPLGMKLFRTPRAQSVYQTTVFAVYLGSILWMTLFNRWGMNVSSFRFAPFHVLRQIINCLFGFQKIAAATCQAVFRNSTRLLDAVHTTPIEDLLLNIILFMPLGFLLPFIVKKLNFWKTAWISALFSAAIETTQYLAHWGCCDIDDIFNNTLGACIGYGCYQIFLRLFGSKILSK